MAVPELVVADAAFKAYPGGVIVLRATDWLGAARGTLSTETDSRAITGECVRDTQTVANSLFSDEIAAFQAADDTLEIDVSGLPVLVGMTYQVWFSILIEGDWDATSSDTFQGATQHAFSFACQLAWYGTANSTTDADPNWLDYLPRDRPHFTICSSTDTGDLVGDEIIRVRAYAKTGTTCEFLIDQVFLIPWVQSGTHASQWTPDDFESVGGQANTFGDIGYDPPETGTGFVDGADGGDNNGKFTWMPFTLENQLVLTNTEGGGDYQKATDEEYMVRVVVDDFYYLVNSQTSAEAPVWAYSVHGTNYRAAKTWVDDDFSRTEADPSWGIGPQGFGWWINSFSAFVSVNGSQGVMTTDNLIGQSDAVAALYPKTGLGAQTAAMVIASSYTFSGTWEVPVYPTAGAGALVAVLRVTLESGSGVNPQWELEFDLEAKEWRAHTLGGITFHGPISEPGWGDGTKVGFKMEIRRYRLKAKVWDASGAEPGTWDYDDLVPYAADNYPYGDDLDKSINFLGVFPKLTMVIGQPAVNIDILWDDILVEYDPYGDPGDMTAVIEQPHGTEIGQIDIPYGAWQMVYWGARDWTALDGVDPAYLSFSARVWNEAGTAELQRAEAVLWYFRSVHGGIIPMNWRSSERPGSVRRVLVGDR